MNGMKILYLITQADGGGAQKYVLTLAKHFGGAIAAGNEASQLFTQAQMAGLETFELKYLKRNINPFFDFLAIWEIRQLLEHLKPDILHINSTKAGVLGSFAAIGLSTKVVFTAHGFIFNEPLPHPIRTFYLALEKLASSYRDFIITVSEVDKKSALDNKLISADKIQTIYNGIPKINFYSKETARTKLGLPADKKIIGVIANDYKTKGLDLIKEIVPIKGTSVVVIGKMNDDKKSDQNVEYIGQIPEASAYLKAFDGFLIPSRKEGFSYTLLEAMQAGLPIVATKVGGNAEATGDAAILKESEDVMGLRSASAEIISDASLRDVLSKNALERSKLFTEQKMLDETETVYKKILKA